MIRALLLGALLVAATGCGGDREAEPEVEQDWQLARAMSSRRSYVAAAQIGGSVYVAGGMVGDTGRPLSTFQRFDAAENRWTTLSRLPEPIRAATAASAGSTVFVIGGQDDDGARDEVYAYDVESGTWAERAPLPEPRFNHTAVTLGDAVYVLGGFAGGEEHADVFVYDPRGNRWTRAGPLPRPNHAFDAVAFRGELWVIGGRRGERILDEVWILDPRTGQWRSGPRLPKPMELLGAAVAGPEIHAVWEAVYQIYDARSGRWRDGPRPRVTRHALQTFYVAGSLYTIGGCTTQLRDSPIVERRQLPVRRGRVGAP